MPPTPTFKVALNPAKRLAVRAALGVDRASAGKRPLFVCEGTFAIGLSPSLLRLNYGNDQVVRPFERACRLRVTGIIARRIQSPDFHFNP